MSPSTFLSRFKGNSTAPPDPNSRHARMASISSVTGVPSSLTGTPLVASPPSSASLPPKDVPQVMPRLVLTTDTFEHDSIHAPATPSTKRAPSILDDKEAVYMSPESASEEDSKRIAAGASGRSGVPQRPLGALNFSPPTSQVSEDLATPTTGRRFQDDTSTPKANGSSLANGKTSTANTASQSKKGLTSKGSSASLRKSMEDNHPPPNTFDGGRSRSNTQLLALPSDGGISDSASIISASGKKKKKLWRKASSNSMRKPTGGSALGAAMIASGMSLAHPSSMPVAQTPAVSPERLRQDTMRVLDPPTRSATTNLPFKLRRGSGDTDMDSEGAYDSDSQDGMSFDDHDIPITGFAVASSKRNMDFHEVFPDVPEGDYLIEDYGCALQREILVQGRMYISENHVCFHANIFGWVTNFTIPFTNVIGLEKKMTAFVIPNAIQIATTDQKYVFASFLSRDTTFDVIGNIWRLAHPGATTSGVGGSLSANASDAGSMVNGAGSLMGSLGTSGLGSPKGAVGPGAPTPPGATSGGKKTAAHKATQCDCGKNKTHYAETPMDVVFPGTPEKIYNLMFASGFAKDFMAVDQKLLSIQVSDWAPTADGSQLLARNMSYIKPLNGAVGPKQTKCELREETVHVDFDSYVSTVTTTRTPDVPSGGSFSVKTRTCIMWAGPNSTKVIVTTAVEWTGRSFLKSIIERSCIDGQRTYHADLERAMRAYINEHKTEFLGEGADAIDTTIVPETPDAADAAAGLLSPTGDKSPDPLSSAGRRTIAEQRGMQWALDTFTSAMSLTSQSFWGLIDIISDAWEAAPDMPDMPASGTWSVGRVWWMIVVGLISLNVWTWSSLSQSRAREELTRKRMGTAGVGYGGAGAIVNAAESEKEMLAGVATEAVRMFWEGVVERQNLKWKDELEEELRTLKQTVAALEARLGPITESSAEAQPGPSAAPGIEALD